MRLQVINSHKGNALLYPGPRSRNKNTWHLRSFHVPPSLYTESRAMLTVPEISFACFNLCIYEIMQCA